MTVLFSVCVFGDAEAVLQRRASPHGGRPGEPPQPGEPPGPIYVVSCNRSGETQATTRRWTSGWYVCEDQALRFSSHCVCTPRQRFTYLTAPAVRPLTIYRSSTMPMIASGAIAAVEIAAIAHQLMPCDPV